jgi:hypothetical protein
MELNGGTDCGVPGGDEKSERMEEKVASGGSVWVERLVRQYITVVIFCSIAGSPPLPL